jgi:hypothetical protein
VGATLRQDPKAGPSGPAFWLGPERSRQLDASEARLAKGLEHHQAGPLGEPKRLYQEILRLSPLHANALHLLGLVRHQGGAHKAAVELIR